MYPVIKKVFGSRKCKKINDVAIEGNIIYS